MNENIKRIGFVVYANNFLPIICPLANEFYSNGYDVYVFGNKTVSRNWSRQNPHIHPEANPWLHKEHIQKVDAHNFYWYENNQQLSSLINEYNINLIFIVEAFPFLSQPNLFRDRKYKVFNLVFNVDNKHTGAIAEGVIDKTIVPSDDYGKQLKWDNSDYIALGSPRYDIVGKLNKGEIIEKYSLPEKYILMFLPNSDQLSLWIIHRIIKKIKEAGYRVILKGKKPKCHRWQYKFLGRYFLNELSFYPYITHELIYASSGVVGFDTTGIEEALCFKRPLVNFHIKKYRNTSLNFGPYHEMWNSRFCRDVDWLDNKKNGDMVIGAKIPNFTNHFSSSHLIDFKDIQRKLFFVPGDSSEKIRNFVENIC